MILSKETLFLLYCLKDKEAKNAIETIRLYDSYNTKTMAVVSGGHISTYFKHSYGNLY